MPSFTTLDGLNIFFRDIGEGKPLVMAHGWMVGGAVFDPLIDALTGAGMRLIIPDQRGVGDSAKPMMDYALRDYARDLAGLIDTLNLKSFNLLGHSMGGQIAQLVAADLGARVQTMVLMCPVPASGVPLPDELRLLFRTSSGKPEAQTQILKMATKTLDDAGLAALLETASTVYANAVAFAFDSWTKGGFEDRLGDIAAGKTYVIGTDDPFLPREVLVPQVVERIANAEFGYYDSRDDSNGSNPLIRNSEWRVLVGYEQEIAPELTGGVQSGTSRSPATG